MKRKPLIWVGSSKEDLLEFPEEVRRVMGFALGMAKEGEKHVNAKPLKGFGGANVLEIVDTDSDGTYRTMYTVKMAKAVFVLHAFQKKSKQGISTPKQDMDLVERRLKLAQEIYKDFE